MNKELIEYIEAEIIPRYADFDRAHSISHVRTVISESMELAENLSVNKDMVYAIAAYHDTGLAHSRETHHLVSGEIVMTDSNLRRWFTEEEIKVMTEAVEDHRASAKQEPRSIYGMIVAEADRNIDTDTILLRTIQFGLKYYPELNKEEHYSRFLLHLNEKYAPGGYMRLWFPESKNALQLKKLQSVISDEQLLREKFEFFWGNE